MASLGPTEFERKYLSVFHLNVLADIHAHIFIYNFSTMFKTIIWPFMLYASLFLFLMKIHPHDTYVGLFFYNFSNIKE